MNIVWTTGTIAGASLGGLFADTIGWRWYARINFIRLIERPISFRAFLIQVPIALIAIIAVSLALHLPKVESGGFKAKLKRVDFLGAISLVSAVFFLLFGLDRGGNVSWNDKLTKYSICAFVVAFVTFAFVEMEWASEPFAPKRIIVNRSLISSYLVNFFGIASGFTMIFYIALYFQAVQGRSASAAGIWLLFSVGGSLTGSLCGGLIIQGTGKYYLLTLASYIVFFLGTTSTTLSSGVIVTSSVGIALGECFEKVIFTLTHA